MTTKKDPAEVSEAAVEKVKEAVEVINDQGFYGVEVDKTPNENYTVAGVTAGKPTPETEKGN